MSKFAQQLTAKDTGNRKLISSMMSGSSVKENPNEILTAKVYEIGVKFGINLAIPSDDLARKTNENEIFNESVAAARKAIVEEVFGEFRGPISELRVAIYERDFARAKYILSNLEHQMFVEGLE